MIIQSKKKHTIQYQAQQGLYIKQTIGSFSGTSTESLFVHCFQVEVEFGNVDFGGWRKTGQPGENPSDTTQLIHGVKSRSNPGHIVGKQLLSPLHHPCSPTNMLPSLPALLIPAEYQTHSFSLVIMTALIPLS